MAMTMQPTTKNNQLRDWSRSGAILMVVTGFMALLAGTAPLSAQPEPPRFDVIIPDLPEVPRGFDEPGSWRPMALAEDGTIYGQAKTIAPTKYGMFKLKAGEPGQWLWRGESPNVNWRPRSASNSGIVQLDNMNEIYEYHSYFFIPQLGRPVDLINRHSGGLWLGELNALDVAAGSINAFDVNQMRAGKAHLREGWFEVIGEPHSNAHRINDIGSLLVWCEYTYNFTRYRMYHADGSKTDFELPHVMLGQTEAMNNADEAVGVHERYDSEGSLRFGGWYWSRERGFVEIPFLQTGEDTKDVTIHGISDAGWVLGIERYLNNQGFSRHIPYLWHVESGFYLLEDLYEWEGRFFFAGSDIGCIRSDGLVVIKNQLLDEYFSRPIVLVPQ